MKPLSLFLVLLLSPTLFAQTAIINFSGSSTVLTTKRAVLKNVTNPEILGVEVVVDPDSKPTTETAFRVEIIPAKDAKVSRVLLSTAWGVYEKLPVPIKDDMTCWLIKAGTKTEAVLQIIVNDPNVGTDIAEVKLVFGSTPNPDPGPGPGPNPDPNIPDDIFDNLGRKVATWATGQPKNSALSSCFVKASTALHEDPTQSINAVMQNLNKCIATTLGSDFAKYKTFLTKYNEDLQGRWPMDRNTLGDYIGVVALGLSKAP